MKNTQIQNLLFNLCKFWIFIALLQSLYAWFTWGQLTKSVILVITFLHCIIFALSASKYFTVRLANLIPLFLFSIAEFYMMKSSGILNISRAVVQIVIVAFVLFLTDEYKIILIRYITIFFAMILSISLIGWILFLLGLSFPHEVIKHPDFNYWYDNYYIFLADNKGIVPRFCSIFLEPGHLGMITAFLLYANKFDLKRKAVLIIFVATIFTFSLAAYVLTFISAASIIIINSERNVSFNILSKRKIIYGILFAIVVSAGVYGFSRYKSGDNVVNRVILSRLKFKNGNISGNDRFSPDFSAYFNSFKKTKKIVLGIGNEYLHMKWKKGNAGWKVFIVQYGVFGVFLVFIFYASVVYFNKSNLAKMFLIIYTLCFLQAAYPLWLGEIFIFITALPLFITHENNRNHVIQAKSD